MTRETLSAKKIKQTINARLEAAGLGPTYRVGLPARLTPATPDGLNWHFINLLSGDMEEIAKVTAVLANARRSYIMADD